MPNTCLNNNHLPGQFYVLTSSDFWTIVLLTLLRMCSKGQRILFARFIVENRDNIWCNFKKEMNQRHINLALKVFSFFVRFIIFLINANLTNSSWTPLPKAKKKQKQWPPPKKKKNSTVYCTFNNFLYLNRNSHLLYHESFFKY